MDLFGAAYGWGMGVGGKKAPVSKICHTYPAMMKLATVTQKYMNRVTYPLSSADISIFSPNNTDIAYILINNF